MIDLLRIPASEAERIANAEGFPGTAELLGRIVDLERKLLEQEADYEAEVLRLETRIEVLRNQLGSQ